MAPSTRTPQPIRAVLALRCIPVARLAANVEVSAQWMSRVVNGYEYPSADLAQRCASYLHVDVDDLFTTDMADEAEMIEWVRKSRASQGLPPRVQDVATLDAIATILATARLDSAMRAPEAEAS